MSEHKINVRMSPEFVALFAPRDRQGNRLEMVLGGPDAEGFYTPTIIVDETDNPMRAAIARAQELERRLAELEAENRALRANISASVLRRLEAQAPAREEAGDE